ncbi:MULTISPECIES: hypothetical protein [Neobacillus]|uniref:Uncharacterized protein n=1 Tax=Neobacillus rhizophilus TaxID=2833579 RepID=A0A942U3Z3_9BACI|nr:MULTISPECIES: hypothetical protein [Neobacillus]MBS4212333.1 hypothetical protein [Neobacillus rhizophilus]MBU8915765.1 hypothetical protein [Bacillus sp. FJAT-29953]
MVHLLYYATPILAAFIVFGPVFLFKSSTISENKSKYYEALTELEKDPKNEKLKLSAIELGRKFYGSARITGTATTFDEAIINCEIYACEMNETEA